MLKMSSISAQGVVERASAELSKRINGLGLRSKHHHGKTSVMERVTNALCGGSGSNHGHNSSNTIVNPDKRIPAQQNIATGSNNPTGVGGGGGGGGGSGINNPCTSSNSANNSVAATGTINIGAGACGNIKQSVSSQQQQPNSSLAGNKSQTNTPQQMRKHHQILHSHHQQQQHQSTSGNSHHHIVPHFSPAQPTNIAQLFQDDRFLSKFFLYFSPYERRILAQVCTKWRDVLYRCPRYWSGLLPSLQCRELRQIPSAERVKLYNSLIRRGFHALCLVGATDEDALDVVHSFPLASKHVHSLSLRCSSISDRGLEALLDHLQVS